MKLAKVNFFKRVDTRIVLPTLLAVSLFIISIFAIIIPAFRSNIMERKKEMIKELSNMAWSILFEKSEAEKKGIISREEAQKGAITLIRNLRYGDDQKDYFWLININARLIMHPYKTELEGQDLRGKAGEDPTGKNLFIEMVSICNKNGSGYLEYLWQWKDDPKRIVPKLSFVKKFEYWEWIVGTGIYIEDVKEEIAEMANRLIRISLGIIFIISLLLFHITRRTLKIEKQRFLARKSLEETEEKYRLLITTADEAIFIIQDEVVKFPNPKTVKMTGYSTDELERIPLIDLIHPDDREMFSEGYSILKKGNPHHELNPFRIIDKSGKEIWVILTMAPLLWDKKPGILCFFRDITEEKKLEAKFLQAQKMEAVGRLAGGVAHDFNNMLAVIIGHTELTLKKIAQSDPIHDQLQKIKKAALRSSELTRQLLAFARKEIIAPKVLNLNDTVSSILNMLQRLIGEDIDLAWTPAQKLWAVRMDSSQIDRILANLCVNARDAINGVGKVIIETGNITLDEMFSSFHPGVVSGDYVLLSVADTGCGMDKETQSHLFEPFFTTKGVGVGTGLGLATIYGIVKQNNGVISVYSEPGKGTIFRIYFPRYVGKDEVSSVEVHETEQVLRGSETVLLVEDEPEVLNMSRAMLEELGYKVLTASSPVDALRIAKEKSSAIQLTITDMVMPEMNGPDLICKLIDLYPEMKWVYMSGYAANVISHWGVIEEGIYFIQKPFSMKDLAEKVREAFDGKRFNHCQKPYQSNSSEISS